MLLSSLREVISNQAHEIQTLQKTIKDSTASGKTKDEEVRASRHYFFQWLAEQEFRLHL